MKRRILPCSIDASAFYTSSLSGTASRSASQAVDIQQRLLLKQVVARVRQQPQLGKDGEQRASLGGLPHQRDGLASVEGGVGDAHHRVADPDPDEIVPVRLKKPTAAFIPWRIVPERLPRSSSWCAAVAPRRVRLKSHGSTRSSYIFAQLTP
jgi:hypothetical protein